MQHGERFAYAALLLLAVSLRAAALLHPHPINIDEARYLVAAHHLRSGVGYSDWRGPEIDIHPLHPGLVAILGVSIGSLEPRGRAVTFVCSILLLWPLVVLARRLGGPKATVLFLVLAGSHPWLVRASASVQPESLYVLLTASALVALWPPAGRAIPVWRWTLAGALFGLAYLARPEGLLVGFLACGIALLRTDGSRWSRACRFGALASALLACAFPYLGFLRSATGNWTVTGKTAEVFFVGQALFDSGGAPAEASAYVTLMERWKGVLPYVTANPGIVALRAANNAMQIGARALPRALGPAGLLGLLACCFLFLRQRDRRLDLALVAAPALTLLLMLLTYRNDQVIGSTLPFLLVVAATGLAAIGERLSLRSARNYRWVGLALVVAVLCGWLPAAVRAARSQLPDASLDRRAVALALEKAGSAGSVVSNNPALSFYATDPSMFGPPGRYTPIRSSESCSDLARDLLDRGARIAMLDGGLESQAPGLGSMNCPLQEAAAFEDPVADRRISILTWK